MKKILFIGDLRVDYNYGAMATTTCLLDMLNRQEYNAEYKYIALRSLYGPTPRKGFPKETKARNGILDRVKSVIKLIVPHKIISIIRGSKSSQNSSDFVPFKFSQFEEYYRMMMDEGSNSLKYEKDLLTWADVVFIIGEGLIGNSMVCPHYFQQHFFRAKFLIKQQWPILSAFHRIMRPDIRTAI